MTKEEIKNATLEELTNQVIKIRKACDKNLILYFKNELKLNYKDFKKYRKKSIKEYSRLSKELWSIIFGRPAVMDIIYSIYNKEFKIPVLCPGVYVKDFLEFENKSAMNFANEIGITFHHLIDILDGKEKIDEEIANLLSKSIGLRSETWLFLQQKYDNYLEVHANDAK